ncbi:MAG: PUA domain-containing protein [Thermoprotei archaeon]
MNLILHPLSKKEAKPFILLFTPAGLLVDNASIWAARVDKHTTVYFLNKQSPVWIETSEYSFPYIGVAEKFAQTLSEVWVDDGAAERVALGADLMAPGVVRHKDTTNRLTLIRRADGAVIAVGAWVENYLEALRQKHGKVALNIHFNGDRLDRTLKQALL